MLEMLTPKSARFSGMVPFFDELCELCRHLETTLDRLRIFVRYSEIPLKTGDVYSDISGCLGRMNLCHGEAPIRWLRKVNIHNHQL